jgi:hypothetical protein
MTQTVAFSMLVLPFIVSGCAGGVVEDESGATSVASPVTTKEVAQSSSDATEDPRTARALERLASEPKPVPDDLGCECRGTATTEPECDCTPVNAWNAVWNLKVRCDGCHYQVVEGCHITHIRLWC